MNKYNWNVFRRYHTSAYLGTVQAETKEQAVSEASARHGCMIDVDLNREDYHVTTLASCE